MMVGEFSLLAEVLGEKRHVAAAAAAALGVVAVAAAVAAADGIAAAGALHWNNPARVPHRRCYGAPVGKGQRPEPGYSRLGRKQCQRFGPSSY